MSLLDKIRQESESPSVRIKDRSDALMDSIKPQEAEIGGKNSTENILEVDFEAPLIAELESYPAVSSKKLGVRLEEEILEQLQYLCRSNKITVETLLEAFYKICSPDEDLMTRVINESQSRMKRRTRAGNIRSILTKSRNLRDKMARG